MKVLLRKNVPHLGKIGDVVDVKRGYGRNYLVPQGLGFEPTEANIKAVEADKERYLAEVAKHKAELEVQAAQVRGKEVTITARANELGHLYGSVGPAQIVAGLAAEEIFVEASQIRLGEHIRQLDKYDIDLEFGEEVTATIHVWVVPSHDSDVPEESEEAPSEGDQAEASAEAPAEAPAEPPAEQTPEA